MDMLTITIPEGAEMTLRQEPGLYIDATVRSVSGKEGVYSFDICEPRPIVIKAEGIPVPGWSLGTVTTHENIIRGLEYAAEQ
jgi:hypothetical protein